MKSVSPGVSTPMDVIVKDEDTVMFVAKTLLIKNKMVNSFFIIAEEYM